MFQSFFSIPLIVVFAYKLLANYYELDQQISLARITNNGINFKKFIINFNEVLDYNLNNLTHKKIKVLYQCFEYQQFDKLWLNLFIEMIQSCDKMSSIICYKLFKKAADYSSHNNFQHIIPVIKKLLNSPNSNTIKVCF